jgi:hypothetical protein
MGWFDLIRGRKAPQGAVVSFDEEAVTCRRSSSLIETVKWSDLRAVAIHTTDAGPFVDDVFYVLMGETTGCVVPSEAAGMDLLLERLHKLPNFDFQAAIKAMSSTEDQVFPCWQRADKA